MKVVAMICMVFSGQELVPDNACLYADAIVATIGVIDGQKVMAQEYVLGSTTPVVLVLLQC